MINQQIIKDFIELVKVDVQSKNERQIADVLKKKLEKIGCEVTEDNTGDLIGGNTGNIIAKLKGSKNTPAILFSAHLDRVKNGNHINPLINNGVIKSDGSTILAADDVAGLVCILDGIRKIKNDGIEHGNIEIVFSVCEEQGILGSKHLDYSNFESKIGYVFDSPGNIGRIINEGPAKNKIIIRIYGKSAHAGNEPEKGINAIKVAGTALAELKEGRINDHTTSNFGAIKGGDATNIVCDYVEIIGEVRSTKQEDLDNYVEYVKSTFKKAAESFGAALEIDIENHYDAFCVSEDEHTSKILVQAMKAIGVDCYFSSGGGGMDANRFNIVGIKTVGIATGYKNNHTQKEEISMNDLIKAGELVKEIIVQASK